MNSSLIKLGIGLAGATTIGGGITAAYLINNKEVKGTNPSSIPSDTISPKPDEPRSIIDFLKDKQLELIGDTEEQKWTPKWDTFKTDFKSVNPPAGWVMQDWNNKKTSPSTPPEFKKLCKDNGAKKINNNTDNNFATTEKYCTKALGS